jgi:tetratricopeptide (TPR) repeat protein
MTSLKEKDEDKRTTELLQKMKETKEKWDAEGREEEEDETDALLNKAIEMALEQGKGWKPGEKEEYLRMLDDDDYLPPLFAESTEELQKTGMMEAFSSLMHDEPPSRLMHDFKKKGNDSFAYGKSNVAKNVQYYRDAVNHYYQAFYYAEFVKPDQVPTDARGVSLDDLPTYTEEELNDFKSILYANAAMAHMQLKNWGHVRDDSKKSLSFNQKNVKSWYRLAKAQQMLQNWEEAGDAIDKGLECDHDNAELVKLQKLLEGKVRRARLERQKRERARAERVALVKDVWKHCKEQNITLGRVALVASVNDDEEDDADDRLEDRWHHHHPHTGCIPKRIDYSNTDDWAWPCMLLYPSHNQSDFIQTFAESDMIASHLARVFPELDEWQRETAMPWDYNNEFICSKLAIYFEVHCTEEKGEPIHPESVEKLQDQGATMRFYEASRALKGDEGAELAHLARLVERKKLHKQRKAWIKKHRNLAAKPDDCAVVRVHPALTLLEVLQDMRMVVPNFLVTFFIFPEEHPAHDAFLKERKCLGLIQPKS